MGVPRLCLYKLNHLNLEGQVLSIQYFSSIISQKEHEQPGEDWLRIQLS